MKKLSLILFALLSIILVACNKTTTETKEASIIVPSGTPSLAVMNYIKENSSSKVEVVEGSDPLIAAFANTSYDVIIAPVNLGAKFYNSGSSSYILAKTIVWGNLYIASLEEMNSIADLNNEKLVVFGKNSTPDVVTRIVLNANSDINVEIEYVSDVQTANSLLVSGKAKYIVTAEPSISKIKDQKGIKTLDLQEEYSKVTNESSYPQAGIFIKKDAKNDPFTLSVVNKLLDSVRKTNSDKETTASNAVELNQTFKTLGADTLVKAIPNCHYNILDNEKSAVNKYLQLLIDLGLGAQVGGKLPDEEFFV